MKKILLTLSLIIALSAITVEAKTPQHKDKKEPQRVEQVRIPAPPQPPQQPPRFVDRKPQAGLTVTFGNMTLWFSGGEYYHQVRPGRFQIVRPPIGLEVPTLHNAYTIKDHGKKYYVSNGIVYQKKGKNYRVVSYM